MKAQKPYFLPALPQQTQALENKSLPTKKYTLLSSLEYRVDNLKLELGISKVCDTSNEGDFIMQKLLAEIKDQDKEHLFIEQVDESSTDGLISSHRCDYADALRAKHEENFSAVLENEDAIQSTSIHQQSLVPSTNSIEASSLEQCFKALKLITHDYGGSNLCLVTIQRIFS